MIMAKVQQKVRIRIFVFTESMEFKNSHGAYSREYLLCSACRKKIVPGTHVVMEKFKDHNMYYHRDCF